MQAKQCAGCGCEFGCGRTDTHCWCNELPALPASALAMGADCLCPTCLAARIAQIQSECADVRRAPAADPAD